jgi:hypothetical protein
MHMNENGERVRRPKASTPRVRRGSVPAAGIGTGFREDSMRRSSILAFALVVGIAPFASAQMRIQPLQTVARPPVAVANAAAIDRAAVNERRLIALG